MRPPINQDSPEIILAAGNKAATTESSDFAFSGQAGVALVLNVTAVEAAAGLTPSLQYKDPISGGYTSVATFTEITNVAHVWYFIGPGMADTLASTNLEVQAVGIPCNAKWRLSVAQTGSAAYSCAAFPIY